VVDSRQEQACDSSWSSSWQGWFASVRLHVGELGWRSWWLLAPVTQAAMARVRLSNEEKGELARGGGGEGLMARDPTLLRGSRACQISRALGGEWRGRLRSWSIPRLLEPSFSIFFHFLVIQNDLNDLLEF
jgi:hypothetical protein